MGRDIMRALKFKSRNQSRPATNLQVSSRWQPGSSPLGLEQDLGSSISVARHRVANTCQQVGLPVPLNDLVDQIVVPFPQYVWEGSSCRRPKVLLAQCRMLAVG